MAITSVSTRSLNRLLGFGFGAVYLLVGLVGFAITSGVGFAHDHDRDRAVRGQHRGVEKDHQHLSAGDRADKQLHAVALAADIYQSRGGGSGLVAFCRPKERRAQLEAEFRHDRPQQVQARDAR